MKRIACLGDSCVDYYVQTDRAYPGGNSVNVSVYLRRLGAEASYVGAVGDDRFGALLLAGLAEKGVDLTRAVCLPGNTPVSYVSIEEGNRVFTGYDPGVMADYTLTEADLEFLKAHDLVVSVIWGHAEQWLGELQEAGVTVAYDCADVPDCPEALAALPHTDIAFFSDDQADEAEIRARIQTLAARGPKIVIAMRGALGSLAWDGETYTACGAVDCPVVDTMGAGDSFIAGFLKAWTEDQPIAACMQAGAENAAVTIGYSGAWS